MKNTLLLLALSLSTSAVAQQQIIVNKSVAQGVIRGKNDQTLLASDANYVTYVTKDGGNSFNRATKQEYQSPTRGYFDEGQSYSQTIDGKYIYYYDHDGNFRYSSDYGVTTAPIKVRYYPDVFGIHEGGGEWSRFTFPVKDYGYLAFRNAAKVFRTVNAGASWAQCLDVNSLNAGDNTMNILDIDFVSKENGIIFGEYADKQDEDNIQGSFIAYTKDAGKTWALSKTPNWFSEGTVLGQRVYVCGGKEPNVLYLCCFGEARMMVSRNGGATWTLDRTVPHHEKLWRGLFKLDEPLVIDKNSYKPFQLLYFKPLN